MIEIKMSTISDGEFNRGVFAKQDIKKERLFTKLLLSLILIKSMILLRKQH